MTMNANPGAGGRKFTMGGVIVASLSVVFANFWRFIGIIIVVGALPAALIVGGAIMIAQDPAAQVIGLNVSIENPSAFQIAYIIASAVLVSLAYCLIVSALTYGSLQTLRGRQAGLGECLSNGLAAIPRILLASIVLVFIAALVGGFAVFAISLILDGLGLGIIITSLAMVAISLYGMTLISVFIPAIVAERAGALECFSRSLVLTAGHRWGIFGLLVLLTVANWAVTFFNQLLAGIAPVAGTVMDIVVGIFFVALGSVLAAVGYNSLRAEKEGVVGEDVVKVFE